MGGCPEDDVRRTMESEESHNDMANPNVIFDATLRREAKQWQHGGATRHRKKQERQAHFSDEPKPQCGGFQLLLPSVKI